MVYKSVNGAWSRANGCENGWGWKRGRGGDGDQTNSTNNAYIAMIRKACKRGAIAVTIRREASEHMSPKTKARTHRPNSPNQRAAQPPTHKGKTESSLAERWAGTNQCASIPSPD